MNVNYKGVIGLAKVIADLTIQGYQVFTPLSDFSAADLIAGDSDLNLRRIQVKYREPITRPGDISSYLQVDLDSVVNGKRVPIDTKKIDGWAIYCPQTDKVYYVRVDEISTRTFRLVLNDTKNRKAFLAEAFLGSSRLWRAN